MSTETLIQELLSRKAGVAEELAAIDLLLDTLGYKPPMTAKDYDRVAAPSGSIQGTAMDGTVRLEASLPKGRRPLMAVHSFVLQHPGAPIHAGAIMEDNPHLTSTQVSAAQGYLEPTGERTPLEALGTAKRMRRPIFRLVPQADARGRAATGPGSKEEVNGWAWSQAKEFLGG